MLRARRPAARARLRADRDQARAGRALRRARLPARRGHLLLQPEGRSAVRRRQRTARTACARTSTSSTRPPAPTSARSSARSPTSTPATAPTRSACSSRRPTSHSQKNLNAHARASSGRTSPRWRARRRPLPPGRARCRSPSAARSRARSTRRWSSRTSSSFAELGVEHVALGDTTGMATPSAVKDLFSKTRRRAIVPIAHFHDSRGTGLVNYVAAYEAGVRHFDSSFGGVGGHPAKVKYGGGFTGNVCTEDLVNLFESMGIATGIDLDGLLATARVLRADPRPRAATAASRAAVSPHSDSASPTCSRCASRPARRPWSRAC